MDTKDNVYYNTLDVFSDNIQLVDEVKQNAIIKPILIKELLKSLRMYRRICDNNKITDVSAYAGSFLGDAKNNKSILEEIYNTCGFTISILTPEEEMKYTFTGAVNACDVQKGIYFYVGERKSYFIQFNRRNMLNSVLLPFGSDDVAELFESEISEEEKNKKFNDMFNENAGDLDSIKLDEDTQILTSGDLILSLSRLARKATRYQLELSNNYVLTNENFNNVYTLVEGLGHDKTKKIKGVSSESANKILAGAKIIKKFMEVIGDKDVIVGSDTIRDGFIESVVLPEILERPLSEMFMYSLENINAFFVAENSNNLKVYELCVNVFKQLKVIHKLSRNYVKPLRIAGYLYDCGKRIDFENASKNCFEIILNSKIKGVSHKEILLGAFAAKLQDLDNFNLFDWVRYSNMVDEEDLDAVKKIGVLVQLASALDASKSGAVDDLTCDILGDSIIMKTIVNKDADFEIKEAMKVNNNFKKVFTKFVEVI